MRLYVYGEQLSFLGKNKELRVTDASFDDKLIGEDEEDSADKIEQETTDDKRHKTVSPTSLNITPMNKRKKPDVERALVNFMENHKMTKRSLEEDEDLAFFYSLLPSVKTLNMDQKFTFRLQTMQFLHNLRKQSSTNRPMHSHSSMHPSTQCISSNS
ncbi:dihydrouridine synthase domain containing protein [Lasius niger]|uniref:Dihydrouridine synthase domain containing protein n=1 Tax=Lasius niger TaxID=67767 RepID=A0A0J7K088_LASNI|nr:dihydrouridine synthase domain containing protein [Lasius niger]